jgi:hypothetical protein
LPNILSRGELNFTPYTREELVEVAVAVTGSVGKG